MKIFITGATGFIGTHLSARLLEDHEVTVLIRDNSVAAAYSGKGFHVVNGDIFDTIKLRSGMYGCDLVFHLAAFTRPASKDTSLSYKTNVDGTGNVIQAAAMSGVKKLIVTSTAGTMGFSIDGSPVNEDTNIDPVLYTEYERTKLQAEKLALAASSEKMSVVVVNPSRVYGPGNMSDSNSVTKIIRLYGKGIWRIIPGNGTATGNYAYIDDVVNGHLLAARFGRGGQRYILGGENLTYTQFFQTLGKVYGKELKMVHISPSAMKGIASSARFLSRITGSQPFISESWIDKYLQNWILSSRKAIDELSYTITPFEEGAARTAEWLKKG
jgi:farnesol dehydrogenase